MRFTSPFQKVEKQKFNFFELSHALHISAIDLQVKLVIRGPTGKTIIIDCMLFGEHDPRFHVLIPLHSI